MRKYTLWNKAREPNGLRFSLKKRKKKRKQSHMSTRELFPFNYLYWIPLEYDF